MGLNIPGYTLFCMSGIDRPRACILANNMNIWMLTGFSCRDLVEFPINYNDGEVERHLFVCFAYLPYDSEDPPLSREFEVLMHYCEEENLYLVIGCDSNTHHMVWGRTNCSDRGAVFLEFLNSSNFEIPPTIALEG
jgi:hypothetical protein